jgi:hypothetical protein
MPHCISKVIKERLLQGIRYQKTGLQQITHASAKYGTAVMKQFIMGAAEAEETLWALQDLYNHVEKMKVCK